MKKLFFVLFYLISYQISYSQFDYGLNAGVSISSSDALKFDNVENNLKGFYAGLYGEINFPILYIRPEINFIRSSSKINSIEYSETNFEIPISFGYKIFPLFSIYAGPNFTSNINRNFNDLILKELKNKKNISFHLGTRLSFGPLSFNITFNLGENETQLISNSSKIETGQINKSNRIVKIGLSYSFD